MHRLTLLWSRGYQSIGSGLAFMLLLGHVGITLGAAQVLERAVLARYQGLDYRLVVAGSLLPDLIDKPVGLFLLEEVFHSGRIMGHTLVFSLVLLGLGVWRYRRGRVGLLSLGVGSLFHLALDQMWGEPAVLWWPLLGWSLTGDWTGDFVARMWHSFLTPWTFATEALGGLILAHFLWRVLWGRQRG